MNTKSTDKLKILIAGIFLFLSMLACADPLGGDVNYNPGTGKYSCESEQYLDSDQAGNVVCRIASK